jgi:hypothetical protein
MSWENVIFGTVAASDSGLKWKYNKDFCEEDTDVSGN